MFNQIFKGIVFAQNFPKYKSSREDNLREENGMSNLYDNL